MVHQYNFPKNSICLITWSFLISPGLAMFFPNVYPRISFASTRSKDAGNPLIITPYLNTGLISLAQNLSRVTITDIIGFESHAGFFTIFEKYNSNLYFWYFAPFSKKQSSPVILWLQGGPGGSSLFGLFMEIGPLMARKEGFALRKYHWALDYHLIFIDNPVGAGFSFTSHNKGYCANNACVARGLYQSLQQFYQLFPDLRRNDLFITGESYAGKYLPELAMTIHQENANGNSLINLKGVAMGNPYCDPINQLDYGPYLYQHGLIDNTQLQIFIKYQNDIVNAIKDDNWAHAEVLLDRLMDGKITNFSYFRTYTGFNYYYDFLQTKSDIDRNVFLNLLQKNRVRRSIHVGGLPFNDGAIVQFYLSLDGLKSVAPIISELLSHYSMMFYSGQLDIILAYPLTENVLLKLNFSSSKEFRAATRHIWRVGGDVAGYWKSAGNLTDVLVRNAGHMVPKDQPKWALDMIRRFISKDYKFL